MANKGCTYKEPRKSNQKDSKVDIERTKPDVKMPKPKPAEPKKIKF